MPRQERVAKKWDGDAHARLAEGLANAFAESGGTLVAHKETILAALNGDSEEPIFTWESVRPFPSFCLCCPKPRSPLERFPFPSFHRFAIATIIHPTTLANHLHAAITRPSTVKMPVKWDADAVSDLLWAMFLVLAPTDLSREKKDEIVNLMQQKGHDVVWNAIRYALRPLVLELLCESPYLPAGFPAESTYDWPSRLGRRHQGRCSSSKIHAG
ncbi:uncharacterized protein E0L32_006405 [Thyridium curvatum]|uniref:Uncharacterized protein n=1 Tax=Thyridium curvatum TaxID=1093900 RepID=A0A507AQR7_9PEZI|nr:uncharacterized protein E0L32_006405 [Thyridium curvatum]TPX13205.1 hypothetical protein E0L32_006405 [Thyridium curvatum]